MDTETLKNKGSQRMLARFDPKNYVTCYNCGTLLLKTRESESIVYCHKCGASEFVYLKNWMLIRMPAKQMDAKDTRERLLKAADWISMMMDAQTDTVHEQMP
ncbi:MAG: hypothetical protein Q4D81_04230 [Eubacteriales bacterium]|nr:hypothetical protein [Eubacteriales bacterium]